MIQEQEAVLRYVGAETNGYDLVIAIIISGTLLAIAGAACYFIFIQPRRKRTDG